MQDGPNMLWKWDAMAAAKMHEAYLYDQKYLVKRKCVNVLFTTIHLLACQKSAVSGQLSSSSSNEVGLVRYLQVLQMDQMEHCFKLWFKKIYFILVYYHLTN